MSRRDNVRSPSSSCGCSDMTNEINRFLPRKCNPQIVASFHHKTTLGLVNGGRFSVSHLHFDRVTDISRLKPQVFNHQTGNVLHPRIETTDFKMNRPICILQQNIFQRNKLIRFM